MRAARPSSSPTASASIACSSNGTDVGGRSEVIAYPIASPEGDRFNVARVSARATKAGMIPGMLSRHVTKAALRRSMEPRVIPPDGVESMPVFCTGPVKYTGWRNPLRGEHYDRSLWEAFIVGADRAFVLASVQRLPEGSFEVQSGAAMARVADAQTTVELAAGSAMAKLSQ